MPYALQLLFFGLTIIVSIIIGGGFLLWWFKGGKLYTSGTNERVKDLLIQEKEIIGKISNELNNAGTWNKWQLKRKLGPKLYKWYSEQGG